MVRSTHDRSRPRTGFPGFRVVLVGAAAAWLTGCEQQQMTMPRVSMPQTSRQFSKEELRDALEDFGDLFVAITKQTADELDTRAGDNATRRITLEWKVQVIPACRLILGQEDPVKAFVDMWTLCERTRQYLAEGEGKELFGERQELAVSAIRQLEAEIEQIGRLFLPEERFDQARGEVAEFAKATPMRGIFAQPIVRTTSAQPGQKDLLASIVNVPLAPFRAFEGVDRGAAAIRGFTDVAARFSDIVAEMPEVTRWQLELVLFTLNENPVLQAFLKSAAEFSSSSASLAATVEVLPERLRKETAAFVAEIDERQENLQKTLDSAEHVAVSVEKTLRRMDLVAASIDETARSVTETGRAWQEMAVTIGETIEDIRGGPSETRPAGEVVAASVPATAAADESGRPFDIRDYQSTAEALTATATEMRQLTIDIRELIASEAITERIQDLDGRAAGVVDRAQANAVGLTDHMTWRAAQLAVLIFVLALIYRFVTARWAAKR